MLGAIAGDIIGSRFEHAAFKSTEFSLFHPRCRFTDDTVLTVALADSLLHGVPYVELLKSYYQSYPHAGYGGNFHRWARSDRSEPYNSWGNGSAMRVSPVGFAFDTLEQVLDQARRSAKVRRSARRPPAQGKSRPGRRRAAHEPPDAARPGCRNAASDTRPGGHPAHRGPTPSEVRDRRRATRPSGCPRRDRVQFATATLPWSTEPPQTRAEAWVSASAS